MYYEINVSKNGKHFFATAPRSIIASWKLASMVKVFRDKFPASEGYTISASRWEKTGQTIDLQNIDIDNLPETEKT